jgi:hypothetical protein
MAVRLSLVIFVLLVLVVPALAQTPPPAAGGVLTNPEAPRPAQPANPSGVPPLPTILPPSILMPGSGR